MQASSVGTFVRFQANKAPKGDHKQHAPLPSDIEEKLADIARKYGADPETAKEHYRFVKGLTHLALSDKAALDQVDGILKEQLSGSPESTTLAVGEDGGKNNPYWETTSLSLGEEGGRA